MVVTTIGMGTYGATWEAHGYCGTGEVAGLVDTLVGRPAIVCGNGERVFDELKFASRILEEQEPVIFAVNDVGMYLKRLDHWVSLHTPNFAAWKAVRWLHHRGPEDVRYHGIDPGVDYNWISLNPLFALSGYFAMQIAFIMGASPIVLCGCPGNQTARFFEADARSEVGYGNGPAGSDKAISDQFRHEMQRLPELKATVRSMGGWTNLQLGGI